MSDQSTTTGTDPKAACDALTAAWIASFQAWSAMVTATLGAVGTTWQTMAQTGAPKPDG